MVKIFGFSTVLLLVHESTKYKWPASGSGVFRAVNYTIYIYFPRYYTVDPMLLLITPLLTEFFVSACCDFEAQQTDVRPNHFVRTALYGGIAARF